MKRNVRSGWVSTEYEADATVVAPAETVVQSGLEIGLNQPTHRRSAEFIPKEGIRKTGELTMVWQESRAKDDLEKNGEKIGKMLRFGRGRLRFVLIGAVLPLMSVVCVLLFGGESKSHRDGRAESAMHKENQTPPTTVVESPRREPLTVPQSGTTDPQTAPSRLRDAADALLEGRLDEALVHYRALAAASPEDPSFALAVKILVRGREGASK